MDKTQLNTVPSLSLAFLGDAVYAVYVREYLIKNKPYLKPDMLHRERTNWSVQKLRLKPCSY